MLRTPFTLLLVAGLTVVSAGRPATGNPAVNKDSSVDLPHVEVRSHPWTCFGLSFAVLGDPHTHKISHLVIWKVVPNSEADAKGIQPGDEIVEAGWTPVGQLTLDLDRPDNRFRELFINRKPGDRIRLKIRHGHKSKPFVVELTERQLRRERYSGRRR